MILGPQHTAKIDLYRQVGEWGWVERLYRDAWRYA